MKVSEQKFYTIPDISVHVVPFRLSKKALDNPEYFTDVVINPSSLLKIIRHSLTTAFLKEPKEIMGMFLGHFDENNHVYFLTNSVQFPTQGTGASVTADNKSLAAAHYYKDNLKKLGRYEDIIGAYHSHPNLHVFYSKTDVIEHTKYWRVVYGTHVGLVIDPCNTIISNYLHLGAYSVLDAKEAAKKPPPSGDIAKKYGNAANYYYQLRIHYLCSNSDLTVLKNIVSMTYGTVLKSSPLHENAVFLNAREERAKKEVSANEDIDPYDMKDLIPSIAANYQKGIWVRKVKKTIFG